MESDKLRLFLRIVETGSLSKAAIALGYTQSAASYTIQSLEEELGVTLLHRSKRGMQLTSDGQYLVNYVRDCMVAINKLYSTAHFLRGVQIGVLRVAAFSSISLVWLPEILQRFHTLFPKISIDIVSGTGSYSEMESYLQNGVVDCSFVALPTSSKFHYIELVTDPLYLILPLHHPLAYKNGPISFAELNDVPFIVPAEEKNEDITRICRDYNFSPHVAFTMYDDLSILGMVENGLGCTISSNLLLQHFHYHVAIKELEGTPSRTICLAFRSGEESSPLLSAFSKSVKDFITDTSIFPNRDFLISRSR